MTTASTVGEKDAFGIDEANVTNSQFVHYHLLELDLRLRH